MFRAAGRTAPPGLLPLQEGGVSLQSKLGVFSRRMGLGLADDDWDPASQGDVSDCKQYRLCLLPSSGSYSLQLTCPPD